MFDEKDAKLHKGLMKILDGGTFPLQAKEVGSFMQIYNWAATLQQTMKRIPSNPTDGIREIKKPKAGVKAPAKKKASTKNGSK